LYDKTHKKVIDMIGTVLPYVTSGLGIVLIGDFNKGDIRLI